MLGYLYRKYIYYTFNKVPEVAKRDIYRRQGDSDPFEMRNTVIVTNVKEGYVQYKYADSEFPFGTHSLPVKEFVSIFKKVQHV